MQQPIRFIYQGTCADCGRYSDRGMAAANGLVICASCFQQQRQSQRHAEQRQDTNDIVYVEPDPALQEACLSVPFGRTGGLRITTDDGRVFKGPAYKWWIVAWQAQQAGAQHAKVEAIQWLYR